VIRPIRASGACAALALALAAASGASAASASTRAGPVTVPVRIRDAIVPVHGTVVAMLPDGGAVLRTDAVPQMLSAGTRRFARISGVRLRAGDEIDAYADLSAPGGRLRSAAIAPPFVAGLPNGFVSHVLGAGDALPGTLLVDQDDRLGRLNASDGRVTLLSFVFTRCADRDLCPAISAKFAYLARRLDPAKFRLVEITIDPQNDSPPVLRAYAARFGANPKIWTLYDGEPAQVKDVLDAFGISSIRAGAANFVHDDKLVLARPDGTIALVVPTAGWEPDDVEAQARDLAGLSSSPARRFELATIAGIVAVCGGSTQTAQVFLDSAVFLLGVAILGSILAKIGHHIFTT